MSCFLFPCFFRLWVCEVRYPRLVCALLRPKWWKIGDVLPFNLSRKRHGMNSHRIVLYISLLVCFLLFFTVCFCVFNLPDQPASRETICFQHSATLRFERAGQRKTPASTTIGKTTLVRGAGGRRWCCSSGAWRRGGDHGDASDGCREGMVVQNTDVDVDVK